MKKAKAIPIPLERHKLNCRPELLTSRLLSSKLLGWKLLWPFPHLKVVANTSLFPRKCLENEHQKIYIKILRLGHSVPRHGRADGRQRLTHLTVMGIIKQVTVEERKYWWSHLKKTFFGSIWGKGVCKALPCFSVMGLFCPSQSASYFAVELIPLPPVSLIGLFSCINISENKFHML